MPSSELTWALYGMAIVAAPTVAVWLWRWLGRKRATRCKCMGWHPDYGSDTSLCPVHGKQAIPYAQSAKAPGSKPDAPWVTREEFEIVQKESIQNHSAIWCVEKRLDALEAKEPEAGRVVTFANYAAVGAMRLSTVATMDSALSIAQGAKGLVNIVAEFIEWRESR